MLFINDFKALICVADDIDDIYKRNALKTTDTAALKLCLKYARLTKRVGNFVIIFYAVITALDVLLPIIVYVLTDQLVTTFNLSIPLLEQDSILRFAILYCVDSVSVTCWYLAWVPLNVFVVSNILNLMLVPDLIVAHVKDLENDLRNAKCDMVRTNRRLIEIMAMHQKQNE